MQRFVTIARLIAQFRIGRLDTGRQGKKLVHRARPDETITPFCLRGRRVSDRAGDQGLQCRAHEPQSRYGFAAERIVLTGRNSRIASSASPQPESHIEGLGLGVECVDDDRMNSELLRKVERSRHGVAKEISAQASAMNALVDSEAREENDWHGVSWKLFGLVCGQALRLDLATGQGVVTETR